MHLFVCMCEVMKIDVACGESENEPGQSVS